MVREHRNLTKTQNLEHIRIYLEICRVRRDCDSSFEIQGVRYIERRDRGDND